MYDTNREHASQVLYYSIKQHLIDYNEDHKEYELDDGEREDSDQIYEHMKESRHKPPAGYEAIHTSLTEPTPPEEQTNHTSSHGTGILIILILFIILIAIAYFIFPSLFTPLFSLFS